MPSVPVELLLLNVSSYLLPRSLFFFSASFALFVSSLLLLLLLLFSVSVSLRIRRIRVCDWSFVHCLLS
ncbi:hypothetical protein RIF29_40083 [Crotalaria pallida]|uniref:Uncharacterized protein n=1 Tax=Crotalaria pallida TaxID=3830 RepID=A0AAN9E4W9_CROPI